MANSSIPMANRALLVITLLFAPRIVHSARLAPTRVFAGAKVEAEANLGELDASRYREYQVKDSCEENARDTFEHFDIADLTGTEKIAFETRFVTKMVHDCEEMHRKMKEQWMNDIKKYLEDEKPALTAKRVAISNEQQEALKANDPTFRGFKLKADENDSMESFKTRLMTSDAMADEIVEDNKPEDMHVSTLPLAFEVVEKWANCANVFRRVSYQGQCASCWAFAGMSTVESRLCIASEGKHTRPLSRAVGSNCVAEWMDGRGGSSKNACRGGSSTWVWAYLDKNKGIPSEQCIPYYGSSERIDYFQSGKAPACRSECQVDFRDVFAQDSHFVSGMHKGNFVMSQGSKNYLERARLELFENGPYPMTMAADRDFAGYTSGVYYKKHLCMTSKGCSADGKYCANHGVMLTGYTPVSWIGLNSWGESWGRSGAFEIDTCMGAHWVVPGPIQSQSRCPSRNDCRGRTCEEWVDYGQTCAEIKRKYGCDCSACHWQNGAGNFESLC